MMASISLVGTGLAGTVLLAVVGAGLAAVTGNRARGRVVGVVTALQGVAAAAAGAAAVTGERWRLGLPDVLPLFGLSFDADALGGWFLLLVGAVTAVVGVYAIGYTQRSDQPGEGAGSRTALAALPIFTAAMALVPLAASVPTLLVAWELMAAASLILVLAEHRHGTAVRSAGAWYAAMTQAGFVALLIGLSWLAVAAGTSDFDGIREANLSPAVKGAVFLLVLVGFASKAGAVPLHPWLPRAHAEAPSHASALMSAAMVKLGVYGILRLGFDLLGGGTRWWWVVVAAIGALSALYGIVQAAVARDLKRLLAFSTSENVGLILLGIGFAGMLLNSGRPVIAALALTAAILHTATHAGFKTLLFGGAGAVLHATGTRDLDRLGGLSRRMPATTGLVAVGALAAAALPPGSGFISEWLLLQALLHPGSDAGTALRIGTPLAVAVIALTAGIGVATYVKVVGIGFLARPRSPQAEQATEAPASMRLAMGLAALACVALAVVPAVLVPAVSRILGVLRLGEAPVRANVLRLQLDGMSAIIWPLWTAVGLVLLTTAVALAGRALGRRRRRQIAWDCGGGPLTVRMEYTATSFAEPLQRVFDDVLAPERDVDVTHVRESAYHVEAVRYRQRIPDRIENRLYRPVLAAVTRLGEAARGLASGSVHRYLAYMLAALVAVLLVGAIR